MFVLLLLLFFLDLPLLNVFHLLLVGEILFEEKEDLVFVSSLHGLLESKHLITNIITNLDGLVFVLELFSAAVLEDHLALLICTLVFLAPLLVLLDLREEHQLITEMAADLEYLNELLQNMRAWPHPQLARALEWATLGPLSDARLAKELPTVVALHGVDGDLEADAANQRVLEFLMHLAVEDSLDIVAPT